MISATIRGTGEVGGAVFASTLTTVAVFFPIVFVEGVARADLWRHGTNRCLFTPGISGRGAILYSHAGFAASAFGTRR